MAPAHPSRSPAKYMVVRDYLRSLIDQGLGVGCPIPSERELCETFSVSRMTVRQAIDTLVVDGVLERHQGKGTFVAPPKVDLQLRLTSFSEEMRRRGMRPTSRIVIAETIPASPTVADALEVQAGSDVHHLRRVRMADDVPMAIEENWVPAHLVPDLLTDADTRSIYAALTSHDMRPDWGEDVIEACLINAADATLLQVEENSAGLFITRRTYRGDVAVDFSYSLFRADRYTLWVPVASPRPTLTSPAYSGPSGAVPTPLPLKERIND
ncbi:GntR family transcriptional regulator [Actinomyces vulturis]|uniref:GntR family transcriptional regulator n=1 Tax=Actinomyces vulturis TaxID=1857645 RepID=UPI00082E7830|nr:GntR family transcriptional regulator [Actinomyces vulturis]